MQIDNNHLFQILHHNSTLSDFNEFKDASKTSLKSLIDFLEKQKNSDWDYIKECCDKYPNNINEAINNFFDSMIDISDLENTSDKIKDFKEIENTPSPLTASTNTNSEDEITLETQSLKRNKFGIRGNIRTYEIDMMGGFNPKRIHSNIHINPNSKVRRPIKVTGVLGDIAGDHVIPLALFVDNIQNSIANKQVHQALNIIIAKISQLGPGYSPLIEEARKYSSKTKGSFENQFDTFCFLKSTFIPGITAIWNQKVGSAFHGRKSASERGKEGARIRAMLQDSKGEITDEIITSLIENVDYKLVKADSITSSNAYVRLYEGSRTNHYTTLAYILGEVAEYYITQYNNNPANNTELTRKFLSTFFEQNPEWVDHFKKHFKDFGEKRFRNLKTLFPKKYNDQNKLRNLEAQDLMELIIRDIAKEKPSLVDISHENRADNAKRTYSERMYSNENSSGKATATDLKKHKKPNLAKELFDTPEKLQNYLKLLTKNSKIIVEDVGGEGNCFFNSISAGMKKNKKTPTKLRELAVAKLRQMYKNDTEFENFVLQHAIQNGFNDIESYVQKMSQNGTWADEPIIRALSEALGIEIHITNDQGYKTVIKPISTAVSSLIHVGHFGEKHYVSIRGMPAKYNSAHLVHFEKGTLQQETQEKPIFIDILSRDLSEQNKSKLEALQHQEIKLNNNPPVTSFKKTKLTMLPEQDHNLDHAQNLKVITDLIRNKKIDQNNVICLERKEKGKNFGMQDVIILAKIIKHNEEHNDKEIPIPEKIRNSLNYQDALLYKVAAEYGIEATGVEGLSLQHGKKDPLYNLEREEFMAKKIREISASGKDVILPIGASHVSSLKHILLTDNIEITPHTEVNESPILPKVKFSSINNPNSFVAPPSTTKTLQRKNKISL